MIIIIKLHITENVIIYGTINILISGDLVNFYKLDLTIND